MVVGIWSSGMAKIHWTITALQLFRCQCQHQQGLLGVDTKRYLWCASLKPLFDSKIKDLLWYADCKFSSQDTNLNPARSHRHSRVDTLEELFPASWVSTELSATGFICGCMSEFRNFLTHLFLIISILTKYYYKFTGDRLLVIADLISKFEIFDFFN